MATQATSSSPSSTSSSSSFSSCPRWKYDVFLSFCGVDTRMNFTDHLYTALKQKGIITFRDDEKLERGKYISVELLKAIEESKNQRGTLAKAFAKHEEDTKVNTEDMQAWKAALKDVGHLSGWHLHDRHESIVIQEILKKILGELNLISQNIVFKDLVGIESRVDEMLNLYLDEGLGGVRFVGICGMGGMGKTTIAQEIFKRISGNFEATCFIANIREETNNQHLVSLQKQLLSKILMESEINIWNVSEGISAIGYRLCNKKVLIVLDDVDEEEQLEALAGKHDWFGLGSRIIVTSRDRHLLRRHGVDDVYTTKGLNDDEALELFSRRAFKNPHPKENYAKLSKDFVRCADGLPLALNVLGNSLFDKTMDEWKSALDKLKIEPDGNIMKILQISFDGLMDTEKELFLDMACFFKGKKKDFIRDILESFGYHPNCNIRVLMDKSLITIEENGILWMHDLLQKLGQEIVRRKSPKEPGERSRLWIYKDVLHVLQKNTVS
nr:TMV resistance protein N-like [Quercus suber]